MKINQNISAVIVNDQLLRNEYNLSESVKKLSSGFKFNSAKDNPSGVAISYKMQAQINALNRASANATDGTSMVETIDGAMGEMTSVLQRMRELCVQAASDTNTETDKEAIQQEIDALKQEVNRISTDTEYNGMTLLDGSLDRRSYVTTETPDEDDEEILTETSMFEQISNIQVSDNVQAGKYQVTIEQAPSHRVISVAGGFPEIITEEMAGKISINNSIAEIKAGMTGEQAFAELCRASEIGNVNVVAWDEEDPVLTAENLDSQGYNPTKEPYEDGVPILFVSAKYGSEGKIAIECDNAELSTALGLDSIEVLDEGKDVKASILGNEEDEDMDEEGAETERELYTGQALVQSSGDKVTITDKSGFEMSFDVRADIEANEEEEIKKQITIETTDIGVLQLQIGANQDQELAVRVPVLNTTSMYIDDLNVVKIDGASHGITQMDVAIGMVSEARSKMGAYENSLDFAKSSLDATSEDMTTAISRLGDVDMAQEMTTYTNASVLTQASISVLSQANDLPQQVLSLLQA